MKQKMLPVALCTPSLSSIVMAQNQLQTTLTNIVAWCLVPLVVSVGIGACRTAAPYTSTPRASDSTEAIAIPAQSQTIPTVKPFCSQCVVQGSLDVRSPSLAASGSYTIRIAARDSLEGTIYGPLGIVAARAYCTRDELVILDALAMEAYTAQLPLRDAARRLPFPIEREDLFALLRCELPLPDSSYRFLAVRAEKGTTLLAHRDSSYVDIAELDADGSLLGYQRKSPDNKLLLAVEYGAYRQWDGVRYPERIRIAAPTEQLELVLEPTAVKQSADRTPFRFHLPRTVRRISIE